ncbi:multiple inositol polyphosphate phosphatase 1-like isoform X1 [Mobula hypostoma]|uniref:multiple inositol polyphosphate phosphatase 1-like isoform X1 n=1 Tax=Mobula hypostoma TaxID=723540 RepID=UPI002FC3CA3D
MLIRWAGFRCEFSGRGPRVLRRALMIVWVCLRLSGASAGRSAWAEHYGTKSRYRDVGRGEGSWLPPAHCTQLQLNGLIRHGTRYPTKKNVPRMLEMHQLVKELGDTGLDLVQALAAWDMWYHERMDGCLHQLGVSEMAQLAERLAAGFPRLLAPQNYLENRVKFLTSSKHRCVNSTQSFIRGLERHLGLRDNATGQWEVDDGLLRFFDSCQKFVRLVENNGAALHEVEVFKTGPEMERVIQKMAQKLGVLPGDISIEMVEATFYLCTYEFILKGIVSPWCDLFDKEDVEVLEYMADLKQYWKRSYGYEINGLSSHKLFQNIFQYMDQTIEENERNESISHTAVLRFGHAETLLPVLTLMGYFKDERPLLADNFEEQKNRKFRSGQISPFAANLIFVLYQCNESQSIGEKYKLQLFLNEKPLPFPQNGSLVTDYDEVKNHYQHLIDTLKFSNTATNQRKPWKQFKENHSPMCKKTKSIKQQQEYQLPHAKTQIVQSATRKKTWNIKT